MGLFGPKAGSRSKMTPKAGAANRALTQAGNSPNKRGTPEEVAARDYEALKGKALHDKLKSDKSSGIKP